MSSSVRFRQDNPLRQLAQIAIQVQKGAGYLVDYELLLGDENISYLRAGADSMVEFVQNLMRASVSTDDQNPLLSQSVRHDLRNQVAVVKGFSELMRMELPEDNPLQDLLKEVITDVREFLEVLDSVKCEAESEEEEELQMAS